MFTWQRLKIFNIQTFYVLIILLMKFSPRKIQKITKYFIVSISTISWICALIVNLFICQKYINSIIVTQNYVKVNNSS